MSRDYDGKPFSDVMGELEAGQYLRDVTKELRKLVHAVRDTRKAGALTLSFKLSPTGRGNVEIASAYTSKVPEHDRPATVFFTTPDATLLRDDPEQPRLPLRRVDDDDDQQPIRVSDGGRE